jgi:NAD+ synthase
MFSSEVLKIDAAAVVERIVDAVRMQVFTTLRRRGAVVGMSGGIDSSVSAALAVRALGKDKVLGLFMPERASSDESMRLGRMVADAIGVETMAEAIAPTLEAAGCYRRQSEAIRTAFPEYRDGDKFKLVLPSILTGDRFNVSRLVVQRPEGETITVRLGAAGYLALVAATNYKQRVRKMTEYYHADRLNYAVVGTPNRLEYDQGFFVKLGDGAADFKPIAHLYKTQVYALAACLGIPEEVRQRPPTTDTFSMPQTQEEFYFSLPYGQMDLCLFAYNHRVPADEVAVATGLTSEQVERVFRDIATKRRATRYLHQPPLLVEPVGEV